MRRATNWRVSVIFGAAGLAVVLIAIVYLVTVGFKVAQHRYWKIMDVALVCGMIAAVFAVRYRTWTGMTALKSGNVYALANG